MRAFVFTDASLKRHAGQFVWLSIDTEKAVNAAFLQKYKVEVWPTFYVLDPEGGVALRWVGGATAPQVEKILEDGRRNVDRRAAGSLDEALSRADRLYGQNKAAEAARAYREVLARAPAGWPPYARTLESLLFALQHSGDSRGCAETASAAYPKLKATSSSANVAGTGLDCALKVSESDPARAGLVSALAADAREVVAQRRRDVAVDDISSVFLTLADEREAAGDDTGRRAVLSEEAAYLAGEAGRASSPQARSVFDAHRLTAYRALGESERAIPMLEASERDFADDYNPPARLAVVYKDLKRYDDALAASDRALARAYGPRKIGIWTTRADIYAAQGDAASARATLERALAEAEALPEGQRPERQIAALKKRLQA